jgi:transcriptional regulator with XRE-family HTH domain
MEEMATRQTVEPLTRAANFRRNLRRVFDSWGVQAHVARDAEIHPVALAKIVNGASPNPTIDTIEAICGALEIAVETMINGSATDTDLRIS